MMTEIVGKRSFRVDHHCGSSDSSNIRPGPSHLRWSWRIATQKIASSTLLPSERVAVPALGQVQQTAHVVQCCVSVAAHGLQAVPSFPFSRPDSFVNEHVREMTLRHFWLYVKRRMCFVLHHKMSRTL